MKYIFLIFMVLLYQNECYACAVDGSHEDTFDEIENLQQAITEKLLFNGAPEEQFENASCRASAIPDVNAYLQEIDSDRSDKRVKNFRFENEPKVLVDAFKDMVPRYNGHPQSSCTTVLCAVDEIWGAELGRKLLYMKIHHGYNGSEHAYTRAIQFTVPQIDKVLLALGDLPPEYEKIGRDGNQRLTVSPVGDVSSGNSAAAADATIKLYDVWKNHTNYTQQYTLFHEFAHNIGSLNRRIDQSSEWRRLSRECEVSEYGNTNQREDFAETVMAYRYNSRHLKRKCPEKYEILKTRIFSGREYIDPASCER